MLSIHIPDVISIRLILILNPVDQIFNYILQHVLKSTLFSLLLKMEITFTENRVLMGHSNFSLCCKKIKTSARHIITLS